MIKFQNRSGMTIVEVLIGLVVIGLSAYASYELWTGAEKSTQNTAQLGEMGEFLNQANQIASKVLTDVGPDSNRGVCRFIKLGQDEDALYKQSSGVVPMGLYLFRTTAASANSNLLADKDFLNPYAGTANSQNYDDWYKVFLTDGRWTQDANCSDAISPELANAGRYQRCFKPVPAQWSQVASAEVLAQRDPRVIVNISAIRFMSASNATTNKLDVVPYPTSNDALTSVNALDHALMVTVKLMWTNNNLPQSATTFSVVWPGEYTCFAGYKPSLPTSPTSTQQSTFNTVMTDSEFLHNSSYANYMAQLDYWREHPNDTAASLRSAATSLGVAPGNRFIFIDSPMRIRVMLNVSGIGSGSLDSEKRIIMYSTTDPKSGLDVTFTRDFYTKAHTEDLGGEKRAVTDIDANSAFGAACQEKTYKCTNSAAARDWYEQMDFAAFLNYTRTLAMNASPTLAFVRRDANGNLISNLAITTALNSNISSLNAGTTPNVRFIHPAFNYSAGTLTLNQGTGVLNMTVKNMDNANACPTMCSASDETNPNWNVELSFPGVKTSAGGDAVFNDSRKVACVCCSMKQCFAWGNKLHQCSEKKVEPLDAAVPECEATNDTTAKNWEADTNYVENFPNASTSVADASMSGSGECIAVQVNGSKLEMLRVDCSTSLPVLCYAVGRYFVAKAPLTNTNASVSLTGTNYDNAFNACFNIGTQSVRKTVNNLNSTGLDELLTQQGTFNTAKLPAATGNFYQYVDGGLQGIFTAPQTREQVIQARDAINSLGSPSNTGRFWVNLKYNGGLIETPVLKVASNNNASNLYTSYYDNTLNLPKLRYVRDAAHAFSTTSATAAILIHSRRYKGVIAVNPTQTRSIPVLCWNPTTDNYFLTGSVDTQAEAAATCWNAGAFFLAPTKPLEWIKAMISIAPNHSHLPWPQPKNVSGAEIALTSEEDAPVSMLPAAWVGLSYSSGTGEFSQFYLHKTLAITNLYKSIYSIITGGAATSVNIVAGAKADVLCVTSGAISVHKDVGKTDTGFCPPGGAEILVNSAQWTGQSTIALKATLATLKTAYSAVPTSTNAVVFDRGIISP